MCARAAARNSRSHLAGIAASPDIPSRDIAFRHRTPQGITIADLAREVGVSTHTIYAWKSKYGGSQVSEAQEAKRLREENRRLRKLVADLSLDKQALQAVIEKTDGVLTPRTMACPWRPRFAA